MKSLGRSQSHLVGLLQLKITPSKTSGWEVVVTSCKKTTWNTWTVSKDSLNWAKARFVGQSIARHVSDVQQQLPFLFGLAGVLHQGSAEDLLEVLASSFCNPPLGGHFQGARFKHGGIMFCSQLKGTQKLSSQIHIDSSRWSKELDPLGVRLSSFSRCMSSKWYDELEARWPVNNVESHSFLAVDRGNVNSVHTHYLIHM